MAAAYARLVFWPLCFWAVPTYHVLLVRADAQWRDEPAATVAASSHRGEADVVKA